MATSPTPLTVSQLSSIEWSRSYLWNIMFTDNNLQASTQSSTVGNTSNIAPFASYAGSNGTVSSLSNPISTNASFSNSSGGTLSSNSTASTPFNQWFPATDYQDTKLTGSSAALSFYIRQYKFPIAASVNDITITFPDDAYGTLYLWLKNWYNYIYDDAQGIACIYDCAKQLYIQKLGPNKLPLLNTKTNKLQQYSYWVYPESTVPETYNSESGIKTYSVTFAVVAQDDPDLPTATTSPSS
jgi:hypothetical protein